jgi:hypothetical protein
VHAEFGDAFAAVAQIVPLGWRREMHAKSVGQGIWLVTAKAPVDAFQQIAAALQNFGMQIGKAAEAIQDAFGSYRSGLRICCQILPAGAECQFLCAVEPEPRRYTLLPPHVPRWRRRIYLAVALLLSAAAVFEWICWNGPINNVIDIPILLLLVRIGGWPAVPWRRCA